MSDNPMDLMAAVETEPRLLVWELLTMEDIFAGSKLSYSITFSDTNSTDLKG